MKKLKTPHGVSDFIPIDTQRYNDIIQKISKIFIRHDYEQIKTPTIEYYNTLEIGLGPNLKENSIKFFDSAGEILVLRPDHTTPIARLVATQLASQKMPLRLSYTDPVFRKQNNQQENIEAYQMGIELIGDNSAEADAEVIKLCILSLKAMNIPEFGIDIGHTDFISSISDQNKEALVSGNYVNLKSLPQRGDDQIVQEFPKLLKIYNILKKDELHHYVQFNKGLVKDIQYYTGLIFDCYIKGARQIIGSGGRYNNLLNKYGFDCPAVGFAFNINYLQTFLERQLS